MPPSDDPNSIELFVRPGIAPDSLRFSEATGSTISLGDVIAISTASSASYVCIAS